MLADPQSITIAAATTPLPRVSVGADSADYSDVDGKTVLHVQQSTAKSSRRTVVTLRSNKIAADPLTAVNRRVSSTIAVTVNAPLDGFTITELKDQVVALATYLTASSAATTVKILGGEK